MTIDMTFERREELIRRDERQEGQLELVVAAKKANMSEDEFCSMM